MLGICNCIPKWTNPRSETTEVLNYVHKHFWKINFLNGCKSLNIEQTNMITDSYYVQVKNSLKNEQDPIYDCHRKLIQFMVSVCSVAVIFVRHLTNTPKEDQRWTTKCTPSIHPPTNYSFLTQMMGSIIHQGLGKVRRIQDARKQEFTV